MRGPVEICGDIAGARQLTPRPEDALLRSVLLGRGSLHVRGPANH